MTFRRHASRVGAVATGFAALALVTAYGQPAGNAATGSGPDPRHVSGQVPSLCEGPPWTLETGEGIRPLGKAKLKSGHARDASRMLPTLVPARRKSEPGSHGKLPHAKSHRLSRRSSAEVLANFDGVDAIQNGATAFDLEPPDEGLGAGNGYVVNFVNVTGAIYNTHGGMVQGPFYLNPFFGEDPAANTSDPRVYFDPSTRRWFATMIEYTFNDDFTAVIESHVDLAASRTANPKGAWNIYHVDASNPTTAAARVWVTIRSSAWTDATSTSAHRSSPATSRASTVLSCTSSRRQS